MHKLFLIISAPLVMCQAKPAPCARNDWPCLQRYGGIGGGGNQDLGYDDGRGAYDIGNGGYYDNGGGRNYDRGYENSRGYGLNHGGGYVDEYSGIYGYGDRVDYNSDYYDGRGYEYNGGDRGFDRRKNKGWDCRGRKCRSDRIFNVGNGRDNHNIVRLYN